MTGSRTGRGGAPRWLPLAAVLLAATAGCERTELIGPIGERLVPTNVRADSTWVLQGWSGLEPVGRAAVHVSWDLPSGWDGEVFRVYASRGSGSLGLIATVTSCSAGQCRYTDLNVEPGSTYEYAVGAVDERRGVEYDLSRTDGVTVPGGESPAPPASPRVTALDGALFLQWASTGAQRYRIFAERVGGDSVFFVIGETDGTGYLDLRAANGTEVGYRVAAIDEADRVGRRSALALGVPRPDFHAELLYSLQDSAAASGFRFVESDSLSPVVAGSAASAQWRVEEIGGVLSLVPLAGTTVTSGVLTTALTCGPGADRTCFAIHGADDPDAPTDFSTRPVAVAPELTYLLRVRGPDGATRFAKIRVATDGVDQSGKDLVIFDWAYQLRPNDRRLYR